MQPTIILAKEPDGEQTIAIETAATIPETEQSAFDKHIAACGLETLRRAPVSTLQLNIGLRCNLACRHCHVESGPNRVERLDRRGIERIIELLVLNPDIATLDITGGAPELHPDFRDLVRAARSLGRKVIDRCNLTVLFEPGQEETAAFLAEQGVELVASLPCYSLKNVEQQRGRGVFDGSIRALQQLNSLGYGSSEGQTESDPRLDLVYNPVGAFLPPSQESLETEYREELSSRFGIVFNRLLTITNMPIKRFAHELHREGQHEAYMGLLVNHFNANNVESLMCRSLVTVGYDGTLYDCDFNQALELLPPGPRRTIFDIDDFAALKGNRISTATHCFGCTSGTGSSCGGALS